MDGFRFDLASALCRDEKGNPMAVPPLIHDIAKDPVLSKVLPPTHPPMLCRSSSHIASPNHQSNKILFSCERLCR